MAKGSLKLISAGVFLGTLLFFNHAHASPDEYDPATGEPKCTSCHTPDKRYSIDHTRDETCSECHTPGLSDKYIEINDRYREADAATLEQMAAANKTAKKNPPAKKDPGLYSDMALVPAGEFYMGSNDWWPKSQPEYKANLRAFYMDKYEVTNKRYKTFVDSTGKPAPNHWIGGNIPASREDHPVVFVSWQDADEFCRWEGKRLPTEQEWVKAARGTDKRSFPWGVKFDREKGNTPQYGNEGTMPAGSFENGKSPYGVYDMAGNAWEWVDDWFKPYPGNNHPDENYGEKYKVLKGGSWYDCTYYKCGISAPIYNRIFFNANTRNNNFGFRCAKDK